MPFALIIALAFGAGVGIGALAAMLATAEAARRDREHARQLGRLHLATGARLHEAQQQLARRERRSDALVARLARLQGHIDALREAGTAVAMAAQLDALWQSARWTDSQHGDLGDEVVR